MVLWCVGRGGEEPQKPPCAPLRPHPTASSSRTACSSHQKTLACPFVSVSITACAWNAGRRCGLHGSCPIPHSSCSANARLMNGPPSPYSMVASNDISRVDCSRLASSHTPHNVCLQHTRKIIPLLEACRSCAGVASPPSHVPAEPHQEETATTANVLLQAQEHDG
jgi:hypothetical protein